MHLFAPRVLQLLSFLTKKQAWLSPPEMAKKFKLEDESMSVMTIYRWFSLLTEQYGLTYFPYPRMNLLDLADVYVRIRSPRSPTVIAGIPFSHSFLAEVGLDGRPFLSLGYWVPGPSMREFEDYWKTAKELDLIEEYEVLPARNTHFLFSPLHKIIHEDGFAEIKGEVDNSYFERLLGRFLNEPYEVRLAEKIAAAPITIPLMSEHMWRHCSSHHVMQSIVAKGEEKIRKYGMGMRTKAMKKTGAILRLLQQQWQELMKDFDKTFLQPVVFWPPGMIRNCPLQSFRVKTGSTQRMMDLAMRVSEKSVLTALMPGVGMDGSCRIWCNSPSEQLPSILRLMKEYHRGPEPSVFGVVDLKATRELVQPEFCGFDWQSFDPVNLEWRFDGEAYMERLKRLKAQRNQSWQPSMAK